jgi:Leucine-rich repeat (LRR) protein
MQSKRTRNAAYFSTADQSLESMPSILVREIAAHVPASDIPALMRSCHAVNAAIQGHLQQNGVPVLSRTLAPNLIHETTDPIRFVLERAQDATTLPVLRPLVRIHGRQVPTQEVLGTLYQAIIEILQTKEIDPIRYVCTQAQGNPRVTLYGQTFDTIKILQDLTAQGETPLRIRSNNPGQNSYDINNFLGSHEDAAIFPACDALETSEKFLQTLNTEELLDYVQWHSVRFQGTMLQELLPILDKLCAEHPHDGIVLCLDHDDILTHEGTQALAKYPITALFIEEAHLPEGIGALSPLKHLRTIIIEYAEDTDIADSSIIPSEFCQLSELRALDIIAPQAQTTKLIIPIEISNLKKLQYLRLNTFTFDGSLSHLSSVPNLKILKLISPSFVEFPKALCDCINIQWLYWDITSGNYDAEDCVESTEIPMEIAKLQKLRALRLSYGEKTIMVLPASIGHLKSLSHLNLSISRVQAIPQEIKNMKALCLLDLELCDVPRIPEEICELPNLKGVYLSKYSSIETYVSFKTLKYLLDHDALRIDLNNFQLLHPLMELREALLPYQRSIDFFNALPINQEVSDFRHTHYLMRNFVLKEIPYLLNGSILLGELEKFIDKFQIHPIYLSRSEVWTTDQYFTSALSPFAYDFEQCRPILSTLTTNIKYIESKITTLADKKSPYAQYIMKMKPIIDCALDLLNPSISTARKQEIFCHIEELLALFDTLSDQAFVNASQEFEQAIYLLEKHKAMLFTVAHNIEHIEGPYASKSDKASEYSTLIMQLKDVVGYAFELLNPALRPERCQEILDHPKELLELLTLLENKAFIDDSQKFELDTYLIKDDSQ